MLIMEHRTPHGLEIRMYGKEARRVWGVKVDRNERDETEEELKARFAAVLASTDFAAIAKVYAVNQTGPAAATPAARKHKPRRAAVMPQLQLTEAEAIPSFLGPKK